MRVGNPAVYLIGLLLICNQAAHADPFVFTFDTSPCSRKLAVGLAAVYLRGRSTKPISIAGCSGQTLTT